MSRRTERVASLVRTIIAEAIQNRLSDPRIERMTSITRVEISPDMSLARVFVSVMAPQPRRELTLTALKHAAGRLRRSLADGLSLRLTPTIDFRLDDSLQQSFRTVQEIDRLMDELGEGPEFSESADEAEPEREGAPADAPAERSEGLDGRDPA